MKMIMCSFLMIMISVVAMSQKLDEGKKLIEYERYESAQKYFHDIIQQDQGNAEAWYLLTQAYTLHEGGNTAFDSLRYAPPQIFDDPFFLVANGLNLLNQGKKDSASISFGKALSETRSKDAEILAAIANAHITSAHGDANYALSLLQQAMKRDKKNPDHFVLAGNAYRKLHNGSEAYKSFKSALEYDENSAPAYYEIGKIFLTQKNAPLYLEYFNKAISADQRFAPAFYELYEHFLYVDPAKAMEYFNKHKLISDVTIRTRYGYTDLLYLTKEYQAAIQHANQLINDEGDKVQPRLYKLIAYSLQGLKDTATAIGYMQQYFTKQVDSSIIAKDYEMMAGLQASTTGNSDSAVAYYVKALEATKDSSQMFDYYEKLALISRNIKDYSSQAKWLGKYYSESGKGSNLDLFNWGLAHYRATEYSMADSVFGIYIAKYPTQGFGYYWRARSAASMDEEMKEGKAVPYYTQLITVINDDSLSATDRTWLVEAYGYLAAYEANTQKDFAEAITFFEKVLEVDPGNDDAVKYISILEKDLAKEKN